MATKVIIVFSCAATMNNRGSERNRYTTLTNISPHEK